MGFSSIFDKIAPKASLPSQFDANHDGEVDIQELNILTNVAKKSRIDMLNRANQMHENAKEFKKLFYKNKFLRDHAPDSEKIKKFQDLLILMKVLKKAVETQNISKEEAKILTDSLSLMVNTNIHAMGEMISEFGNVSSLFLHIENCIADLDSENKPKLDQDNEDLEDQNNQDATIAVASNTKARVGSPEDKLKMMVEAEKKDLQVKAIDNNVETTLESEQTTTRLNLRKINAGL